MPSTSRRRLCLALVISALTLVGCGGGDVEDAPTAPVPTTGGVPWPAPPNPLDRTAEAGLTPTTHEFLQVHRHAHLDVFVDGEPVTVPAGIGIDITDPGVKTTPSEAGDTYGGIEECDHACISPLHTHDYTGVLHTESTESRLNTLGEFFTEWGVRLDSDCVGGYCKPDASIQVFVDGDRFEGDPTTIELADQREIAIVIGSPPATVPTSFDFGQP
jgi:hypothetical protein